jgi:hypothetical protein
MLAIPCYAASIDFRTKLFVGPVVWGRASRWAIGNRAYWAVLDTVDFSVVCQVRLGVCYCVRPANHSRCMVEAGMRLTETVRSRRRNSVQSTMCLTDRPTSIVELVMVRVDKLTM